MVEAPAQTRLAPRASGEPPPDLHGLPLLAARGLWLVMIGVVLALTLAGAPGRQAFLREAADTRALGPLGLTPETYAQYLTGLSLASVFAHLATATFIFWRRSSHGMCWLVAFTLVVTGAIVPLALFYPAGAALAPGVRLLVNIVISLGLVLSVVLLYVFPDGHFHPAWTRWMGVLWAAVALGAIFFPRQPWSVPSLPPAVQLLVLAAFAGTGIYAQVHRYLNISSPIQRQQAKWAGLGLVAAVVGPFAYFVPFVILPTLKGPEVPTLLFRRMGGGFFALSTASELVFQSLFTLSLVLFPLLFAIAILRYRLWDIDLLINRALVYGTLTALLTLAFLGSVVLLQAGFMVLTGQAQSTLVTVLSTLLMAAVATPLRRRVQTVIDRRFYRRRYDAARTLMAFSAVVRDEVDLDHLSTRLLSVVDETLEPEQAWLWLRAQP